MTLAAKRRKSPEIVGRTEPRKGPPVPAHSDYKQFAALAAQIGMPLWPWQERVSRYLTATTPDGQWLYPEVATLAARQNGKTSIMVPLIISRLLQGHRILHTAQNRELPRELHETVSELLGTHFPKQLPPRRAIRFGSGQETIKLTTGGSYHIAAPSRGGARGAPNDLVLIDEVLEMTDMEFVSAAKPTTIARPKGQIVYFSNAGTPTSVVLNWLRSRADNDPSLAYLEWSAEPGLAPDDMSGWLQANPAIGHNPVLLGNLEREYRGHLLGGTLDIWEREHLCRQTLARHQSIVTAEEWNEQQFVVSLKPKRAVMGIKMDPSGERASCVLAWQDGNKVSVDVVADVTGQPIEDFDELAEQWRRIALMKHVVAVAFDPATDADLARRMTRTKPLTGRDYVNATQKFVRVVRARELRVHDEGGLLGEDLNATIPRKAPNGTFIAVKASPEVTNTAAEAAIRAVWLATDGRPTGRARVY